ncbi:MAG: GvpL/GvpF family gas vesicle protein [Trebonia sp.]
MSEHGCWMYAVTDRDDAEDLTWLSGVSGVAGAEVRSIRAAGLTALVSDVDLAEFGAEPLRRHLEDLDWLEGVARAHHYVVDAAARLVSLLPIRLATVYTGDASVTAALRERQAEFTSALAQVRDRVEWGVKAYAVPAATGTAAPGGGTPGGGTPGRGTQGRGTQGGGAGMAYLKRRRDELAAREDTQRDATAGARSVYAELAGQASGARLHPPQSPQLSGARAPMLLNAAYLIDRSDGTSFTSAVASAAGAHPELRLELTGPWPPYSFAGGEAP